MDEEQFDLLTGARPFTKEDAARADIQLRRRAESAETVSKEFVPS